MNTHAFHNTSIATTTMGFVCCGGRRRADDTDEHDNGDDKDVDGVELFRRFWDEKLKEVADLISGKERSGTAPSSSTTNLFHVTLQLYAHKDVVDKLYICYDEHPEEVEFYIPQLCTFLLHGKYEKNPQLEFFLLSQCRRSLHFAHRLHWFLDSFCARGATYKSEGLSATVDKISAENGPLLLEIAKQGGIPAKLFDLGLAEDEIDSSADMQEQRASALLLAEANIQSPTQMSLFQTTPCFVKSLTDLADRLIPLPLVNRKSRLRQGLAEIQAMFFPSMGIYLPIGHAAHRVKGLVIDECFPFSTKERVPYLICVEVVDYDLHPDHAAAAAPSMPRSRSASAGSATGGHHSSSFCYTVKLPFNKTVTVAVSSDNDILDETTPPSNTNDTTPLSAAAAPTAIGDHHKSPALSTPSSMPLDDDDSTTTTFVVKPFRKSYTLSFRHTGDAAGSDEMPLADEDDVDDDAQTHTMGQWANRHKKYGKRMVELKREETPEMRLTSMDSDERIELSPTAWSDVADDKFDDIATSGSHPVIAFRERWSEKEARLRDQSAHGHLAGWRLVPVIVKSNDDLRQEQFAAQLIAQCHKIFMDAHLPLSLRPYAVLATSATCGLIEAVPDTVSLDSLKKNDPDYTTLFDFYERYFGPRDGGRFKRARRNFVESLAAYSIVCYVFQIKDRHNGNILVDADGHVIHIDFGFLFTNSPGGNIGFESAPFKLTDEFVELLDGPRSTLFRHFRSLCVKAYWALHQNMDKLILLVEMMLVNEQPELRLPCFAGGKKATIDGLRERLNPGLGKIACQEIVNELIDQSLNNWRTRWYDKYQYCCMGIL
ncbi:Aste57867_25411 [Aphanomyces stellatus]|uniref:1-phosphatidylinositol 4-kinase n=1 Tax=Aphanomyces stellatus TaxID=120398 RepID=A0A485LTQ3_9STRA|nr:hypothetical protein As57867_025332 [Aphanomyces stellatus]VFU02035.1 Aste57867_25411 [Aphanomyces stellatus]